MPTTNPTRTTQCLKAKALRAFQFCRKQCGVLAKWLDDTF